MASPPGFQYLWYEELDEAKAQSRAKHTEKMGRPKRPEDTSEYIWGWVSPPDQTYYLLQLTDDTLYLLSPAEMGDLLPYDDPVVVACFPDYQP